MADPRPIVNLADVELRTLSKGARFEVGLADLDRTLGLNGLGVTLHVVPAGKTAWPYHRHHGNDELFLILSGTGEYRLGEQRLAIKPGDCLGAPAGGEAHQIINSSDGELRYLAFANRGTADVIEFPDSGRVAVDIMHKAPQDPATEYSLSGRLRPFGYWDGEDVGEQ